MNKVLYLLTSLLLFGLILLTWLWMKERSVEPTLPDLQEELVSEEKMEVRSTLGESRIDEMETASPGEGNKEEIVPLKTVFAGKVVDTETGDPVERFTVRILKFVKTKKKPPQTKQDFHDKEGRFSIPLDQGGRFRIWVFARGYLESIINELEIPEGRGVSGYQISLDRGGSISGRVVLQDTGQGVQGATVDACLLGTTGDKDGNSYRFLSDSGQGATTDDEGRFLIQGLQDKMYHILAVHPQYGTKTKWAGIHGPEVILELIEGYRIYGTVRNDVGQPIQGVSVDFFGIRDNHVRPVQSSSDGRYVLNLVPPGRGQVTAYASWLDNEKPVDFTMERLWVTVEDHDVEVNFGPTRSHVLWRGTFYGWQGIPAAKGKFRIERDPERSAAVLGTKKDKRIYRRVACDDHGRFEIPKLLPGVYKVYLTPTGEITTYGDPPREEITLNNPGLYEKDIHFRTTELSGEVIIEGGDQIGENTWFVIWANRPGCEAFSRDLDSTRKFRFRGIPPGEYTLSVHGDETASVYTKVSIEDGQIINDIQIIVPLTGMLHCEISGLDEYSKIFLKMTILTSDGKPKWGIGTPDNVNDGIWESETPHESGSWRLLLEHEELGKVEKDYEIFWNQTTDVVIHASEFRKK